MEKLMLSSDAARLVGVTPASIREAAISGRLPVAAVTQGGVRLFTLEDVQRFLRERKKRAAVPAPPRSAEQAGSAL